jgi:antirestriction protein ArdC
MSNTDQEQRSASRPGLYQEITDKIIRQIEAGTIPWVQPWASNTSLSIPRNASTQRAYRTRYYRLACDKRFASPIDSNL